MSDTHCSEHTLTKIMQTRDREREREKERERERQIIILHRANLTHCYQRRSPFVSCSDRFVPELLHTHTYTDFTSTTVREHVCVCDNEPPLTEQDEAGAQMRENCKGTEKPNAKKENTALKLKGSTF